MTEVVPAPTAADRALFRALRAWGGGDLGRWSSRFSAAWLGRLRALLASGPGEKPDAAWAALRSDHERSARLDTSRVHPSWFVRALRSESPAVRLAVAAQAPGPLREVLREAFGIDPADLLTDRQPDPAALGWALALWAERLVGDVPGSGDDPPVVVALTRLGARDLARLVKACGLAKRAFAIEGAKPTEFDESIARSTPLDRVRLGYFRRHIGATDPRLIPLARLDLQSIEGDRRRAHARVGLVTFGRLLAKVEPHRARWALQHIPYPIAKRMKTRTKETPAISPRSLIAWETWVLEAAWSRLFSEGRLAGGRALWNGDAARAVP